MEESLTVQTNDKLMTQKKEPVSTGSLEMLRKFAETDSQGAADPFLMNGAALAYIGDAVYELLVRTYMLDHGSHMADKLHRSSVQLVNAKAQSDMVRALMTELTETEAGIYKRGRNASTMTAAKHQSVTDYRRATGLEALFGYLYLSGAHERLFELFLHGIELLQL